MNACEAIAVGEANSIDWLEPKASPKVLPRREGLALSDARAELTPARSAVAVGVGKGLVDELAIVGATTGETGTAAGMPANGSPSVLGLGLHSVDGKAREHLQGKHQND